MVEKESLAYPSANLVGASLATYASWLIAYMPFVVLEGVWACVSLIAVFRVMRQPKTAPSP
ncbi:MAG TPA: hypothetical protein DD437_16100 [Rhodobiaceae bacterium]|nr:hypothetical protein [Rhodobiaceae bacterium]